MRLRDIVAAVQGEVVCGQDRLDENVDYAFAGLANVQSVRTAEMSDVEYILFVRGKNVTEEMSALAEDNGMVVIRTDYSMFKTSGILYGAGLKPVY